jgi:hypothetical protein
MYTAGEPPDIYAFERGSPGAEAEVVVWCVHTTVHAWPSFDELLAWAQTLCAEA